MGDYLPDWDVLTGRGHDQPVHPTLTVMSYTMMSYILHTSLIQRSFRQDYCIRVMWLWRVQH